MYCGIQTPVLGVKVVTPLPEQNPQDGEFNFHHNENLMISESFKIKYRNPQSSLPFVDILCI
jgi:hypothetical protein